MEEGWVLNGVMSQNETQAQNLWRLREDISETIAKFTPYKNDVSVRVSRAPAFVQSTQEMIKMNYPDWAPKSLVKLHKLRLENSRTGKRTGTFNPDEYIEKLKLDDKFSHYDEAAFKRLKESLYRSQMFLPDMEGDLLLQRRLRSC